MVIPLTHAQGHRGSSRGTAHCQMKTIEGKTMVWCGRGVPQDYAQETGILVLNCLLIVSLSWAMALPFSGPQFTHLYSRGF